jgi:hypothetical protein
MTNRFASPIMAFLITVIVLSLAVISANCTAASPPASNQPITDRPRGLFLNSANLPTQNWQKIERFILKDPTVSGANIIVPWSEVDRGPDANPQYDWSFIMKTAQPWIKAGKLVNLLVWGAAQKTEQQFSGKPMTPEYVLQQVNSVRCQCQVDRGCDPNAPITPVFWEEEYQVNYRKLVKAIVTEFGNKPWIGYLRFGIGVGAESYPANGVPYPNNPCTSQWLKPPINLTAETWQKYNLQFIDFLASLNSPKTILITINEFGNSDKIAQTVAAAAVAKGFGIGIQGLTENAITLYAQGEPCYADWCDLFEKYQGEIPLELQTAAQSNPAERGRVGFLPDLLEFGLERGVQIFELYQAEWFVANDPNHHLHEKYGAIYKSALQKAARALSIKQKK